MSSVTQRDIWAPHLSMTHLSHICVCDTSMSHSVASKRVTPRIKKSRHIVSHITEHVAHQRTMSHSNEWHDVFPTWHDSFIQVTWLIHTRDMTCHASTNHVTYRRVKPRITWAHAHNAIGSLTSDILGGLMQKVHVGQANQATIRRPAMMQGVSLYMHIYVYVYKHIYTHTRVLVSFVSRLCLCCVSVLCVCAVSLCCESVVCVCAVCLCCESVLCVCVVCLWCVSVVCVCVVCLCVSWLAHHKTHYKGLLLPIRGRHVKRHTTQTQHRHTTQTQHRHTTPTHNTDTTHLPIQSKHPWQCRGSHYI